ncbi:MAG: hypothetical protein J5944_08245 [Lentisphaeria bacterium]|nr:hypothetical protein [Lentisphaeria bacterium]
MKNGERRRSHTFFRILFYAVLGVFILSLLAGAVCLIEYVRISKNPPPPVLIQPAGFPGGDKVALGSPALCTVVVRAPWGSLPQKPDLTPGDGVQLISDPVCRSGKITWGATDWTLEFPLQPYRTGETGKGTLRFSVRGPDGNLTMFEEEIPALDVSEIDTGDNADELLTAGEIAEKEKKHPILLFVIGGAVLILLAVLAVFLFRRRGKNAAPAMSLRDIALDAIRQLRQRVEQSRESAAAAMAELTDIVRHFLEEQYHLRAERQTTGEFLRELNRADSPVTESDRKFLRSFLEAADMVKFARFTADSDIFENAAFRAEKLIAGPGPDPLEGGEKRS